MTTEVAKRDKPALALIAALEEANAITVTGLRVTDPTISYEQLEAICYLLGHMNTEIRFAMGDAIRLAEHLFNERAYQLVEALGLSEEAKREYLRVSERVPLSIRRPEVSWSHHRAVAALEPPAQKEWLARATEERLSHHALRTALRNGAPENPRSPRACRCCGRALDEA